MIVRHLGVPRIQPIAVERIAALLISIVVTVGCTEHKPEEQKSGRRESVEVPVQADLDTLSALTQVFRQVTDCPSDPGSAAGRTPPHLKSSPSLGACPGVIYIWSPLMPLSRFGIENIVAATDDLGVRLTLLDAATLRGLATGPQISETTSTIDARAQLVFDAKSDSLIQQILASGATAHYPSILVHRDGRLVGTAILGYKTAETYHEMIEERLTMSQGVVAARERLLVEAEGNSRSFDLSSATSRVLRDYRLDGEPGPYFRSVPGRHTLAYEVSRRIYLLNLESGRTARGPGYIDFVPTPDGRFFVTPGPDRSGLEFYDADQVLDATRRGEGAGVEPFFTDARMQDQYPSAGILRSEGETTVYRVLTSWFDQVVFRDYEVYQAKQGGRPHVWPLGDPVVGCARRQVSIPILSTDGREVAGRDEATATTKIFRLHDDGTCEATVDLGLQTGKVAFGPDGRQVAFAIPQGAIPDGTGRRFRGTRSENADELAGIFVLDRDRRLITRVRGSKAVYRLAFPDFVGRDSVVFVLASDDERRGIFRVVCCVSGRSGG